MGWFQKQLKQCMACNSKNVFIAFNFGKIPLVNVYLNNLKTVPKQFSLSLMICKDCGLGQIPKQPNREKIFTDYTFRSSTTKMNNEYAKKYVDDIISSNHLQTGDWVLEIASNDGYLLKYFKEHGISVLGVDPAKNISMYAMCEGIPVVTDFFGTKVAKEILEIKGYPKLIVANHVMAHGPYIQDFMEGISILCNNETIVTIENPSIMNILEYGHFDSIYHEHYSYLSCNSVSRLANKFGLNLFDLQEIPVQVRTNRYWISKNKQIKDVIEDTIKKEIELGLFDQQIWKTYFKNLQKKLKIFNNKLKILNKTNKKVYGYAASGKTVLLLKMAKIKKNWITAIADDTKEKQNKFLPILGIPIINLKQLELQDPDEVIVFAWNSFDDIKEKTNFKKISTWENL